jgi:hypothetical protein
MRTSNYISRICSHQNSANAAKKQNAERFLLDPPGVLLQM